MFLGYTTPNIGYFDNFATYLEFYQLGLSYESQDKVYKKAATKMTADDIIKHRLFNESIPHIRNRVLFTTANSYAGLGP